MQLRHRVASLLIVLLVIGIGVVLIQPAVLAEPAEEEEEGPTADFDISPNQPAPFESIRFDASASTVSAEGPVRYSWTYETTTRERRATGETFEHSFGAAGTFTVELTVTDSNGNSDTATTTVTTRSEGPTADFDLQPSDPELNERVVFDASASESPGIEITDYQWYINGEPQRANAQLTETFTEADLYTIELEVEDRAGQTDRVSETIPVGDRSDIYDNPEFDLVRDSPEQSIDVNPDESIPFTAEITSDEVPDATKTFYVNEEVKSSSDIETSNLRSTHQFQELGEHTVEMEVEGAAGQSDTVRWDVITHTFNTLPSFSEQSSSEKLEVGGSTEIMTFSVQNPDANDQSVAAEILTRLPDGVSISGAEDVSTGDAAIQTSQSIVSPGRQESMRLEINVEDESLEGTRITIPYQIRYQPETNDNVVYTANDGEITIVVGETVPDINGDDDNDTSEDSSSDEMPGLGLTTAVLGLLTALLLARFR